MLINSFTLLHLSWREMAVILCKYTLKYYNAQTIPCIFSQKRQNLTLLTLLQHKIALFTLLLKARMRTISNLSATARRQLFETGQVTVPFILHRQFFYVINHFYML